MSINLYLGVHISLALGLGALAVWRRDQPLDQYTADACYFIAVWSALVAGLAAYTLG